MSLPVKEKIKEGAAEKTPGKSRVGKRKTAAWLSTYWKEAAAIVVLGLVLLAAFTVLQPPKASVEDFWEGQDGEGADTLKMIIVKSDRCQLCELNNSLETMFKKNGIPYVVRKYDEQSMEGQKFINELGLEKLPAFLIDGRDMNDEWKVKTKSGFSPLGDVLFFYVNTGQAEYEEDVFVFYELSLDLQPHTSLLLGEACGTAEHILVQYFADPYDLATIATSVDMEALIDMFDNYNVEFVYGYLPTAASTGMEEAYTKDTVETAAKHLMCANDLGVDEFRALEHAAYNRYCDLNLDADSYYEKLYNCGDSNRFGHPLTGEEVMESVEEAGLAGDIQYNICLEGYKTRFDASKALAEAWRIDKSPTLVVNCTYETHPRNAHKIICSYLGDVLICREPR